MYRYWYAFAVCWIWSVVVLVALAGRGLTFLTFEVMRNQEKIEREKGGRQGCQA